MSLIHYTECNEIFVIVPINENMKLALWYITLHFIQLWTSWITFSQWVRTALGPHLNTDITFVCTMSERNCLFCLSGQCLYISFSNGFSYIWETTWSWSCRSALSTWDGISQANLSPGFSQGQWVQNLFWHDPRWAQYIVHGM